MEVYVTPDNKEFRANAGMCQRLAASAKDDQERRDWQALAERWLRMVKGPTGQPS